MSEQPSNVFDTDSYRPTRDTEFSHGDRLDFHMAGANIKPYKDIDMHRQEVARSYGMTEAEKQAEAIRYAATSLKNLTLVRADTLSEAA